MNYYEQFAEMLGLELGQEFRIIGSHEKTIDDALFEITEDGLFSKANNLSGKVTLMLDLLLSGKYKVVPKQWKPKYKELYWFYEITSYSCEQKVWLESSFDLAIWKAGNCFRTEKKAEAEGKKITEQIKEEYEEE